MEDFKKYGYQVIKNYLDNEEINFFTKEVYKDLNVQNHKEKKFLHDILISNPNYWKLFTKKKLINTIRSCLQSDEICFVQHTDLQINHGSSIFHRDNANRKFMSGPDWYEELIRKIWCC